MSCIAALMLMAPIPCDFVPGPSIVEGTEADYKKYCRIYVYAYMYGNVYDDEDLNNPAIVAMNNLYGEQCTVTTSFMRHPVDDSLEFVEIAVFFGHSPLAKNFDFSTMRLLAQIPGVTHVAPQAIYRPFFPHLHPKRSPP